MNTIDEYLGQLHEPQRQALQRVRDIVKRTVPDAEETISYGMPTFKYKGKSLVHFAAFKDHLSLFPTAGPTEVLKDELKDFKLSKGTIQFTVGHPIPEETVKDILHLRLDNINNA